MQPLKNLNHLVVKCTENWATYTEKWVSRVGIKTRNDDGSVTLEMSIIIGIIVVVATAGGAIIMNKILGAANNIPDVQAPAAPSTP